MVIKNMMKHEKFAVFILSHGRPNKITTIKSLKKHGYTGKYYIIIDDEDKTAKEYFKIYGDKVIQFGKSKVKSDTMDNFESKNIVLFARNKCFDIAKHLNLKYFLVLDDDNYCFHCRIPGKGKLKTKSLNNLNKIFDCMIDFLNSSKAKTIAFAQGGDYIGGIESRIWRAQLIRKSMNSFFFKTDNRVEFLGRLNEDVNTYASFGNKGDLFFTTAKLITGTKRTQKESGGLTEEYLDKGTYVKSFYTVMLSPSFVKIGVVGGGGHGRVHFRIHHKIQERYGYPKILNEKWKLTKKN